VSLDEIYMKPLDFIDGTRIRRIERVGIHRAIDPFSPEGRMRRSPEEDREIERQAKADYRRLNRDTINARKRQRRAELKMMRKAA
jgi:hypothetical protein